MPILRPWLHGVSRELITLIGAILAFGSFFVFAIPIGYGSDEPVHAYKAYSVSSGQLSIYKIGPWTTQNGSFINVYGGMVPESLINLESATNNVKLTSTCDVSRCQKPSITEEEGVHNLKNTNINSGLKLTDFWGANSYSFLGYLPSATGFGIARIFNLSTGASVYIARFMNLLFCTLIVALSFKLLSNTRARWIIFSIALFPPTIISFSSLGIDSVLLSLSLLFMASITWLHLNQKKKSPKITALVVSLAIIIPLIKIPYILLSLLILLLPIFQKKRKGILQRIILFGLILVPALLWNIIASDATRTQSLTVHAGRTEPNSSEQITYIAHHPFSFAKDVTSSLLKNSPITNVNKVTQQPGLTLPADLLFVSLMLIFISSLFASSSFKHSKRTKLTAVGIFTIIILTFGAITASMYLTYNPVGSTSIEGVQGRYFLPLYGFIALLIALTAKVSFPSPGKLQRNTFMTAIIGSGLLTIIWYIGIVY